MGAMVVAAVAAALAGCEIEQAEAPEETAPAVIATRIFVVPLIDSAPPDCGTAADNVFWMLSKVEGVSPAPQQGKTVPVKILSFSGGFDDPEPPTQPQPQPGWCVFRADIAVPPGTYAIEAHSTFNGQETTIACSFGVFLSGEPGSGCDAPDWVGFTAEGFTAAGTGCSVVNTATSSILNEACNIPDSWGVFPAPEAG
jgi:hypothetical protein